jgi:hypothetical protein
MHPHRATHPQIGGADPWSAAGSQVGFRHLRAKIVNKNSQHFPRVVGPASACPEERSTHLSSASLRYSVRPGLPPGRQAKNDLKAQPLARFGGNVSESNRSAALRPLSGFEDHAHHRMKYAPDSVYVNLRIARNSNAAFDRPQDLPHFPLQPRRVHPLANRQVCRQFPESLT